MTAALEGGEWSAARPGRTLPPGKTRYPSYRRDGGPQGRSGRAENLIPTGIRSRTVQSVVSHYTDWATGPTKYPLFCNILLKLKYSRQIIKFHLKNTVQCEFSCSMWKDGRTDMTKVIVAFRNFSNAPKNQSVHAVYGKSRCLFWFMQNT